MLDIVFALLLPAAHAATGPELVARARAEGRRAVEDSVPYHLLLAAARNEVLVFRAEAHRAAARNIQKAIVTRGENNGRLHRRWRVEKDELARIEQLIAARGAEPFTTSERLDALRALTHYAAVTPGVGPATLEALAFAEGADATDPRAVVPLLEAHLIALEAIRVRLPFFMISSALSTIDRQVDEARRDGADVEPLARRAAELRRTYLKTRPIGTRCMRFFEAVGIHAP